MIHFKDRLFCDMSDACKDARCPYRFDEVQQNAARAWWGGDDAPVAFGPVRECPEYTRLQKQENQP